MSRSYLGVEITSNGILVSKVIKTNNVSVRTTVSAYLHLCNQSKEIIHSAASSDTYGRN